MVNVLTGGGAGRWAALLASGDEVAALARLRILVHSRRPAAAAANLRQRRSRTRRARPAVGGESGAAGATAAAIARAADNIRISGNCGDGGGASGDGLESAATEVKELGELYAQAARAEPLLRRAAMRLAAATNGAFPTVGSDAGVGDAGGRGRCGGLVAAAALEREWGRAAEERVRWPGLKPAGRALEKLVRAQTCFFRPFLPPAIASSPNPQPPQFPISRQPAWHAAPDTIRIAAGREPSPIGPASCVREWRWGDAS